MTLINITDAYFHKPTTRRAELEQRLRSLKARHWADPGDADLLEQITEVRDELAALDDDNNNTGDAA